MLFAKRRPLSDPQASVLPQRHERPAVFHADAGDDGTLTKAYLAALKAVIAAEFAVLELRFTKELSLLRAEAGVRWLDTAIGFSILATAVLILWPWQSTRDDQAP